jgi:hypothetical protein
VTKAITTSSTATRVATTTGCIINRGLILLGTLQLKPRLSSKELRIHGAQRALCFASHILHKRIIVLIQTCQDVGDEVFILEGFPTVAISSAKPFILL